MKNSADQGGCYPQRSKAEVDNTVRDLQNSSYPTKAEFNNCFIIHSKYFLLLKGVSALRFLFFRWPNITQPCSIIFDVIDSIWRRFWRHWFNNFRKAPLLTSFIQYSEDSFQIWWTAAGYGELCVLCHLSRLPWQNLLAIECCSYYVRFIHPGRRIINSHWMKLSKVFGLSVASRLIIYRGQEP